MVSNVRKSKVSKYIDIYRHFGTLYWLSESVSCTAPSTFTLPPEGEFFCLSPPGLFFRCISKEEFCLHLLGLWLLISDQENGEQRSRKASIKNERKRKAIVSSGAKRKGQGSCGAHWCEGGWGGLEEGRNVEEGIWDRYNSYRRKNERRERMKKRKKGKGRKRGRIGERGFKGLCCAF